jgi:hypothetical protein
MNHYLTSQLVAERQAAVAASVAHRAQIRDARAARAAREATAPTDSRPARTRRHILTWPAHASA